MPKKLTLQEAQRIMKRGETNRSISKDRKRPIERNETFRTVITNANGRKNNPQNDSSFDGNNSHEKEVNGTANNNVNPQLKQTDSGKRLVDRDFCAFCFKIQNIFFYFRFKGQTEGDPVSLALARLKRNHEILAHQRKRIRVS